MSKKVKAKESINKFCVSCLKSCKQAEFVVIMACPNKVTKSSK